MALRKKASTWAIRLGMICLLSVIGLFMNAPRSLPGLEKRYSPATDDDILKFEKKFSVQLPEGYKMFLREYNGGEFSWCAVDMHGIHDTRVRPAPRRPTLQTLRSLALPHDHPCSLYHEPDWYGIYRVDGSVLVLIGQMADASLIFVDTTSPGEGIGEIWLKTTISPVLDGDKFVHYESEWFRLGQDMDGFLDRLRYERH